VRLVDIATESHGSARSLQVRIEPADLEDPERLEQLAETAKLSRPPRASAGPVERRCAS